MHKLIWETTHQNWQNEIECLNSPISIKEITFVVKTFFTKKTPDPGSFIGDFYRIFKEEIIPI